MSHCSQEGCSVEGHHHHHHCCGCNHSHAECSHEHGSCHNHEHADFAHQLIEIADQAWMEVLKDEIRAEIRANHGKHLKKLAKLASDANSQRWKNKMAIDNGIKDFKAQLAVFFGAK